MGSKWNQANLLYFSGGADQGNSEKLSSVDQLRY